MRRQIAASILRHSPRDALLIALAAGYAALLVTVPSAAVIAFGFWWLANTVAHNFIHLPFFRARQMNAAFSVFLSLLLGLPQTIWRDRHLAHHAKRPWRPRWSRQVAIESVVVLGLWVFIATRGVPFLLWTCVAGWTGGLLLCAMQGHFEHMRGTVSHYGWLYNVAFFNDGYHVEHHARPGLHWSALPAVRARDAERSAWPAVLRWLEMSPLDALERMALHWRGLQRFMVNSHARAFGRLLAGAPPAMRVTIVGGGLFPRTTLVVRRVMPSAHITIIDRSHENLALARPHLDERVEIVEATYAPELCRDTDLIVVPLAFDGDRNAFYARPPAPMIVVHDWLWRRRGQGVVVSWLLLKRINLIRAGGG